MTGLDKILSQIQEEAKISAAKIIAEADKKAEGIIKEAEIETAKQAEKIQAQSEAAVQDYISRSESAADLYQKRLALATKQEIINGVIQQAYDKIMSAGDSEYFDLIVKMVAKYAQAQEGEIIFNKKDRTRLPSNFESQIQKNAGQKGGSIKIAQQTANIDGGFVLVYGGVEENCSFKALFDSAKETLQDKVHELLFN
jgi:V/A-type H+-transporting ATPase subunit E